MDIQTVAEVGFWGCQSQEYLRVLRESTTIGLKTGIDYLQSHVGNRLISSVGLQLTF